jgi:hypothetical protein
MSKWVDLLNRHLAEGYPAVRITRSFGHTGNFLADSPSSDFSKIAARFERLLHTDWVVHPVEDVRAALRTLAAARQPPNQKGIRWTPGLAFRGGTGVEFENVATTPRAVLWKISPSVIGVWKHDDLGASEVLNRERRGGGWGAVSGHIEHELDGQWTARSRRTVDGLVRVVR